MLMGDMSIVGPRPHMHSDCNAFSELIPGYKFRNLVKPGITGLAQVKGFHGKVISREMHTLKDLNGTPGMFSMPECWPSIYIIYSTVLPTTLLPAAGAKAQLKNK